MDTAIQHVGDDLRQDQDRLWHDQNDQVLAEFRSAMGAVDRFAAEPHEVVHTAGYGIDGENVNPTFSVTDRRAIQAPPGNTRGGNGSFNTTTGVTQTQVDGGRIIVQVAPTQAYQSVEQLKEGILKVISISTTQPTPRHGMSLKHSLRINVRADVLIEMSGLHFWVNVLRGEQPR